MNPKVFVSSTFLDLEQYRAEVREVIHRLQATDVAMETFGASDDRPGNLCEQKIKDSDCFVGIYAHRYGSILEGSEVSIIESEYRAASKYGLKRLIFIVNTATPWVPGLMDQGTRKRKLKRFLSELKKKHVCEFFTDPKDLAVRVSTSLHAALDQMRWQLAGKQLESSTEASNPQLLRPTTATAEPSQLLRPSQTPEMTDSRARFAAYIASKLAFENRTITNDATETVVADRCQEAVRLSISTMDSRNADEALRLLLSVPVAAESEQRARLALALKCLADQPSISESVAKIAIDTAIDVLGEKDGQNDSAVTSMDDALAAIAESSFRASTSEALAQAFISRPGDRRNHAGACLAFLRARVPERRSTALSTLILESSSALSSCSAIERVSAAFDLINVFYAHNGRMGFLPTSEQDEVLKSLLGTLHADAATQCASVWALCWFTNALYHDFGPAPNDVFVSLDSSAARQLEAIVVNDKSDPWCAARALAATSRQRDFVPVCSRRDWLLEIAAVADTRVPRKCLPERKSGHSPLPSLELVGACRRWLSKSLPKSCLVRFALSVGRLGYFVPEMAPPLVEVFSDPTYSVHTRDEALLYLALEGGETAKSIILAAHATPPEDEDDYLFTRGLLGLMLLDDVDLLKHQIANSLEHFDIEALAACLVGSSDPKGKEIAERLTTHPTAKVRQAVAGARASVGTTSDNEVQNVLETIRTTTRRLYSIGSYFSRLQIRRSVHVVLYRAKSKTGLDFYSYIRCDQRQFEKMAADYRNKLACEDASEYGEVVYTRLGNEPDAEAERFLADYLKGMNDRFGKSAALAGTMANEPRSQKNDTVSDDA